MTQSISEQQLVKMFFVIKDGTEIDAASDDMHMAYTTVREHAFEEKVSWVEESECLRFRPDQLTKKHLFVFEQFSGRAFEFVRDAKAVLVGPRCLISCFLDDQPIPPGTHPVMTTAMRNLIVCSSGLKPDEKAQVSQLVSQMGGYYLDVLTGACTHLVACTVKSVKYEKAAEIKLKIMHPAWVRDVWEQSLKKMVYGTDAEFAKHALPIFYSLTITSTGLTLGKRTQIKKLIEENGGKYIGAFKSELTDILILEKDHTGSDKFRGAVRCKKECLTPAWIVDSVEKGYALPTGPYEVKSIKSSTPTKDDSSRDFNPDSTQLSMISHGNSRNFSTINESVMSMTSNSSMVPALPQPPVVSSKPKYKDSLAKINVQLAKKAGLFLDGCNIYLSGFTGEEKDKLNKILNSGGATRYDELSDGISHVIVGSQVAADFREIREQNLSSHVVTVEWLVRSMELKGPAPEEDELLFKGGLKDGDGEKAPEPPSPASKKNLESMNNTFKRPELPRKLRLDDLGAGPSRQSRAEDELMQQYMEKNTSVQLPPVEAKSVAPATTSSSSLQDSEEESQYTQFMFGKTFFVYGFSEEDATQIVSDCENCGGMIVNENYSDLVDYIVLPTCSTGEIDFNVRGRATVNCLWLETSIQDSACLPLEYYFEPILNNEDDPKPLEEEVLVISSYSGAERTFLIALGGVLGARVEDRLVRKAAPIVICKEPSGAKYEAAIKWELTVLTAEWLRECLRAKRRVNEESFLVGKSICSSKNITELPEVSALPEFSKNPCLPTTSTDDVDIDSVVMPPPERQVYSQELHQYEDLVQSQRDQRKPFDPGHSVDSPLVLKHRRLSTLTGVNSPATPTSNNSSDYEQLSVTQRVMEFETPIRDTLYKVLKEAEEADKKITPRTRRMNELLATPSTSGQDGHVKTPTLPECMTKPVTPYGFRPDASPENHLYHKRKLLVWDQLHRPKQQNQQQQKERRKSTPLSELKRRFWRENLGDEYCDYVESQYGSTQAPLQQQDSDAVKPQDQQEPGTSRTTRSKDVFQEITAEEEEPQNESRQSTGSNVSEKRPREDDDDGDDDEEDSERPAKRANVDEPNFKKLSDLINDNKNQAAAKLRSRPKEVMKETQYTELPRFDSEMLSEDGPGVGWRDPSELERTNANRMQYQGRPIFAMSSVADQQKATLVQKILDLGGQLSSKPNEYDKACTHIPVWQAEPWREDPFRDRRRQVAPLRQEDKYEWGNPNATDLPPLEPIEMTVAKAAFNWRKRIVREAGKHDGVFTGFRVLLMAPKKEQFIRLIQSGGGYVIDMDPPFNVEDLNATHCFVDAKKTKIAASDHRVLAQAGIAVMSIMYLNAYLTSETLPDPAKYRLAI
ncbi:DNA topoisomerase 2-binding protein 1 [Culex quinquefasciatus]|uniref:DNA topoisomerase 2-binding protein 1 n=1 Tax=Culex quinquefasciatus TaxID=7176 RepID=B0WSS7_CULQU|nr:DNA topoisomerase 2-binding protein 1 [Culex quinquefasciatus]|eukprot:XP_001870704.1 DNA topoisomerase 2-binding protein 1 [Culex quinquefasciatus]